MDTSQQALSTSPKTSVAYQALELAEGRVIELTSSLAGAQRQFECAEKHRDLVTRQLDAQKEDYGKLGRQLQKVVPSGFSTPLKSEPYCSALASIDCPTISGSFACSPWPHTFAPHRGFSPPLVMCFLVRLATGTVPSPHMQQLQNHAGPPDWFEHLQHPPSVHFPSADQLWFLAAQNPC